MQNKAHKLMPLRLNRSSFEEEQTLNKHTIPEILHRKFKNPKNISFHIMIKGRSKDIQYFKKADPIGGKQGRIHTHKLRKRGNWRNKNEPKTPKITVSVFTRLFSTTIPQPVHDF